MALHMTRIGHSGESSAVGCSTGNQAPCIPTLAAKFGESSAVGCSTCNRGQGLGLFDSITPKQKWLGAAGILIAYFWWMSRRG